MPKLRKQTPSKALYRRGYVSYLDYQRYLELPDTYTVYDLRKMLADNQSAMRCKLYKEQGMAEIVGEVESGTVGRPGFVYRKVPMEKWDNQVLIVLTAVKIKLATFNKIDPAEVIFH